MVRYFSLTVFLVTAVNLSFGTSLSQRPLASVKLGSTLTISTTLLGPLYVGSLFQKGRSIPGQLDEKQPYCRLELVARGPLEDADSTTLTIKGADGGFSSLFGNGGLTKLEVTGRRVDGAIICHKAGTALFEETSIADFETCFGDQLEWDSVAFEKTSRSNEIVKLTGEIISQHLEIRTSRKFPARVLDSEKVKRWYVQDKDFVEYPDFAKPYCLFLSDSATEPPLAANSQLRLTEVSGGYTKQSWSQNTYFMGKVPGTSLKVYCSVSKSDFPSYGEVSAATEGILSWVFHP